VEHAGVELVLGIPRCLPDYGCCCGDYAGILQKKEMAVGLSTYFVAHRFKECSL